MAKSKSHVIIIVLIIIILAGVGVGVYLNVDKMNNPDQAEATPEASKPVVLNPLTGEQMADSAANKKPVSVMVENSKQALPQWGLSSADIVFETLAEGGITRNIALFADPSAIPKVGPVRSVREYYPEVAAPVNCLFVHFGGSDTGYQAIKTLGLDSIDGISTSAAFKQDTSRSSRGKEHTNYTSSDLLTPVIQKKNFNMSQNTTTAFMFTSARKALDSTAHCDSIDFKFSGYCAANFEYDAATGKYKKSEFGEPQIDGNNNSQISVDNVFVLYANISGHPDWSERMQISFEEGGSGKYVSKGTYTDIHWNKQSGKDIFSFNDMEGSALNVNTGKTWICMIPNTEKNSVSITPVAEKAS